MIPQQKTAAVTRGLQQAFGVSAIEDVRELTGGIGANPVYRIVIRGSAYQLRFNLRAGDLTRHFTCMNAASVAGLAPRVWYTSVEDRLSITDFVESVPFPAKDALLRMPAVLRTLHALPPFPEAPGHMNTSCTYLLNNRTAPDGLTQSFRAANILPPDETGQVLARYEQIAAVYPHRDSDIVSSHNDLFKPDNILYDGRRVWLVDWEAAFRNDRYADLAVVANMLVANDAEERTYLDRYFGGPPNDYQLARFFLMQQVAHLFYGMVFLLQGSSGTPLDRSDTVPGFRDFQQRFWAGEVKLADKPTKALYGLLHWELLSRNVQQARFNEALRLVAGGQT